MVFRVADRVGERRSKAYDRALATLATASFEDRIAPFRIEAAEAQQYGFDPVADAVWIHRTAIAKLIDYAVASPEKNFFAREKSLIQKLSGFDSASADVDRASSFMATFMEVREDVVALRDLFKRTPESVPWLGTPAIGWGVPDDVFWIGISGGDQPWPDDPDQRQIHRLRLRLQPYPAGELWPRDERARAIHLQKLIRPFPSATRNPWSQPPLSRVQLYKVWPSFWEEFLPGLATSHGATVVDHVSKECIYAEPCSFDSHVGRFAFWFPELRGGEQRTGQYRDSLHSTRKELRALRHKPDWFVLATLSLYRFIYPDIFPLARGKAFTAPVLVLDEPCTFSYTPTFPWLFFLYEWGENPRDAQPFPLVQATTKEEVHTQALVYVVVWFLQAVVKEPPPKGFVLDFVETLAPGAFDRAVSSLSDAGLVRVDKGTLRHHNVPMPGICDVPETVRGLGFEPLVERLLAWVEAYEREAPYARRAKKRLQSRKEGTSSE